MKTTIAFLVAVLLCCSVQAGLIYQIDIDTTGGATESGWTSLNTGGGNTGSVVVDGITFSIGSADGSRDRSAPNDLARDFAFDDGGGEAVIMFFGGAGDLKAGVWEVSMWSWDNDFPSAGGAGNQIGPQIAAYRTNGSETIVATDVPVDATNPAITFRFTSDGVSAYDVFFRENNPQNRTRLNAVRLEYIPEPATTALLAAGIAALASRSRRRQP